MVLKQENTDIADQKPPGKVVAKPDKTVYRRLNDPVVVPLAEDNQIGGCQQFEFPATLAPAVVAPVAQTGKDSRSIEGGSHPETIPVPPEKIDLTEGPPADLIIELGGYIALAFIKALKHVRCLPGV
jgi:hypothetical protein